MLGGLKVGEHLRSQLRKAQQRALNRTNAKTWKVRVQCSIEIARYLVGRCAWPADVPSCDQLHQVIDNPAILDPILGTEWHIVRRYIGEEEITYIGEGQDGYLGLHTECNDPITISFDTSSNIFSLDCRVLYFNMEGRPQYGVPTKRKRSKV
jgi:hypothetical protein